MSLFNNRKFHYGKVWVAFLLVFLMSGTVFAQQKKVFLSLQKAIETAIADNSSFQTAKIDEAIMGERLNQSNVAFLPQANFSYTSLFTNNPLNAFGFKLQQSIVKQEDFNPALLNHPSGVSDFSAKIDVLQPLLNMDAVYMKKSIAVQLESYQLKTERVLDFLTYEVQKAYYQLQLTHQAVSVFEEALVAAKSFYDNTMNRFNEGLIQKSDLLNVEVQMLDIESQLDEAKSNIVNASDYLSVLMNQPTGTTYTTEKMFESLPNVELSRVIPLKRSDFLAMDKAIIASGIMMKSLKMKQLPRLNLFASYQLNNKKIFSFNANAYLAGIQLSWNLFDGNATRYQLNHMKLEQSKLQVQLQSMQLENQMMLDKSFRDQGNALFRIKQQKAAIAQAEESWRILQNRYQEGLVSITDILNAQTQVSKQKLLLAQAVCNNNIANANIEFLTKQK